MISLIGMAFIKPKGTNSCSNLLTILAGREDYMTFGNEFDVFPFIRANFSSAWPLEILLVLHSNPDRSWSVSELVGEVRGSETVTSQGVKELLASGLAITDRSGIRLDRNSDQARLLAEPLSLLYRRMPEGVRRLIGSKGTASRARRGP